MDEERDELEDNTEDIENEDFDPKKVKHDDLDDEGSIIDDGDNLEHDADFNDVDHDAGYTKSEEDEEEDLDGFSEEDEM